MRPTLYTLIFWLSLAGLGGFTDGVMIVRATARPSIAVSGSVSAASVDPNKAPSEFNHHIAGWALIGVGALVLASFRSPNLRALRYVWPALFLLAGLFLALWSDGEIWPRGNLNWIWLVHHDQEAGQHKIYALLLIAIAVVEYLRARGSLNRFWGTWTFCILAIVGAALLLIHDHTAGSGANSPEARAYMVNPALGPDGKLPAPQTSELIPGKDRSMMDIDHGGNAMDHSGMDHSAMDHSSMRVSDDPARSSTPAPGHHHQMTPSMMMVEREHFWFMIVGLGVALFKLISDGKFWRGRFVPYAWPCGMVLLGVLLVFYQE
jgi:cell division protein FtsW (lipid II flippase)